MTWANAESYCLSTYGTHLATITSSTDYIKFRSAATAAGISVTDSVWFGMNDIDSEGMWVWADANSTFTQNSSYTNWDSGEPNNGAGSGQDCGQVYSSGHWDDVQCDVSIRFVCNAQGIFFGSNMTSHLLVLGSLFLW